jgi:hypothetical protein
LGFRGILFSPKFDIIKSRLLNTNKARRGVAVKGFCALRPSAPSTPQDVNDNFKRASEAL